MHDAAYVFVRDVASTLSPLRTVYEVGGRFLNGRVRPLFPCKQYVSVDLLEGADVDVVGDFAAWQPGRRADCIVCCEVLEHTPLGSEIVSHAWNLLQPDGYFVVTCATDPRAPHSGIDGLDVRPDEWYRNVPPEWLHDELRAVGFRVLEWQVATERGDLYALAQRPNLNGGANG